MLIGQPPGLREYETGKPFHGHTGQNIRRVFEDIGISDFDEYAWSSAVVKCYPGRKLVKSKRRQGFEDPCSPDRSGSMLRSDKLQGSSIRTVCFESLQRGTDHQLAQGGDRNQVRSLRVYFDRRKE
ncbi:MAG: uracil-DNA glycosylase family protein [Thermodesulfobacteriota bacterium]